MRLLHIVGRKNHGKTALMLELIEEFSRRGLRVGSIKHSSHAHDLDQPGKDSYRHRQAGANPAAIITSELIGVYRAREPGDDFYSRLEPLFDDCDLVLVEGHLEHSGPKIEVWRASVGGSCLAAEVKDIIAVVSDDALPLTVPVWPRRGVPLIADRILAFFAQ
ncbi:MAG: molybdopterin-guanine dinucleotide biosynthesis protein B [Pirellulales bacterium]|nr:molybdopterin-guanine dinucleotide biosynthesis protein B [Pirellulales bacterium]